VLCHAVLCHAVQAAGADLIIALTHMRQPNDILLAQQVPEIDAVLGGHDHHYNVSLLAAFFGE
jgi:5'-nucleotidase